jgi:nicotinamide riboside transporter PnuC
VVGIYIYIHTCTRVTCIFAFCFPTLTFQTHAHSSTRIFIFYPLFGYPFYHFVRNKSKNKKGKAVCILRREEGARERVMNAVAVWFLNELRRRPSLSKPATINCSGVTVVPLVVN